MSWNIYDNIKEYESTEEIEKKLLNKSENWPLASNLIPVPPIIAL